MESNHLEAFSRMRKDMIRMAREVAERGYSYRGFKVGCAVLVWRPKGIGPNERYHILKAANAKPIANKKKYCAEMVTTLFARSNGYERVVAIAIAGLPQRDGKSGIQSETLHPCEECRELLPTLPEITRDTIILSVHNHSGKVEQHTLEEILKIHKDPIPW